MKKHRLIWLLVCAAPLWLFAQAPPQIEEYPVEETYDMEEVVVSSSTPSDKLREENVRMEKLDREAWQKATEGLDYSGSREKKKRDLNGNGSGGGKDREGGGKRRKNSGIFSSDSGFFNSDVGITILKILVIIIAAVALFFLIRSLMGLRGPRNRKLKTAELLGLDIAEIEDRFQELNLDDYIRQAIERGDYPLAVRLYYLAALKALSARELIQWKKDKTNLSYLLELRGQPQLPAFQEITHIFEWVWYGQGGIDRQEFERVQPKMKGFLEGMG
ncbi:MAG: DUF4129 domain-containing protein [Saprospiraceae bacterium]|nr:DUF4129 domain-containing protein [Saprospiraceae bacterium]HRF40285.1 DUF4129 domain-containing protein [Saprospiraceae bacterium]HRJ16177.1 DUF4129 domain-containing protein [Saprospiraceae bacterium]HRK82738.1 DUF4129 domain-containing protein [Saprospiraceae bacterium]